MVFSCFGFCCCFFGNFKKIANKKILHNSIVCIALFCGGGMTYIAPFILTNSKINTLYFLLGKMRNGLFFALPMIWFGILIRESNISKKVSKKKSILIIISLFLLTFLENHFLLKINNLSLLDMTFLMPFLSAALFVFCLKLYNSKNVANSSVARKLSMLIYVFHYAVVLILNKVTFVGFNGVFRCGIVFLITVTISVLWMFISEKFHSKDNKCY